LVHAPDRGICYFTIDLVDGVGHIPHIDDEPAFQGIVLRRLTAPMKR
jgi:hypothetical protein